jgi:enoyl-CoA hydratase/carnithine racemase
MSEVLHTHEDEGVLVMRLNRPSMKNALNLDALRQLAQAYTALSQSDHLRCGLLCGEGDVFCAGLDLADVLPAAIQDGPGSYLQDGQCDPFRLWGPGCKKPIITAVHGRCYTAGLELVLAGDMCVAATGTQFAQLETKRGIFPFGGGTLRLPEAIGWGNAMRCILAGGTFSAEDALRWGLVQELADTTDLPKQALQLAREVVSCAPLAVQAALANARVAKTLGIAQAIDDIRTEGRRIALTQDAREGMMSLMQRRPAKFVGA